VALCVAVPAHLVALAMMRISPGDVLRSAGRPLAAGLVAVLVALGVDRIVDGDLLTIVLGGLAGGAAFAAVAWPVLHLVRPPRAGRHRVTAD
jgi:hypothetical protein